MNKRQLSSVGLLLAAAFVWIMAAPSASAQTSVNCSTTATVASGNTLSAIANEYLGRSGAYRQIVDATNTAAAVDPSFATIENAALIRVGWKLCIPRSEITSEVASGAASGAASGVTSEQAAAATSDSTAEESTTQPEPAAAADQTTATEQATAPEPEPRPGSEPEPESTTQNTPAVTVTAPAPPSTDPIEPPHPLMIEEMRRKSYPGSELVIEQTLEPRASYTRYVASYQSDGYKIFGLLTVPTGDMPESGWPVILFNHGYIPPEIYRTTERYVAYQDAFARNGYISFKSDYRGHGSSEGAVDLEGGSGGTRGALYTADVLNALASLKRRPDVDANRIGMWGHSMGGQITLRAMVVSGEIKAGSLWAGTVADHKTMWDRWEERAQYNPDWGRRLRQWREELIGTYGTSEENPAFWASITPNAYLTDLSGPVLIQHATGDASVPVAYSDILNEQIEAVGGDVEYFRYEGDDHNLSANLRIALTRDVAFFDSILK